MLFLDVCICCRVKGNGRLSLVEDLESVVYDGGSVSIGDECSILRETAGIDVWFVFGDGLDNLTALPSSKKHGSTDSVPFQVPVHYLTSSAEADFDALRRGANASAGGLFIDLRHVVPVRAEFLMATMRASGLFSTSVRSICP